MGPSNKSFLSFGAIFREKGLLFVAAKMMGMEDDFWSEFRPQTSPSELSESESQVSAK